MRATDYFTHVYSLFYKNRQPLFVKPNFMPTGSIIRILPNKEQPKKPRSALDRLFGRTATTGNNNAEIATTKAAINQLEQSQMVYQSTVGSENSDVEDSFEPAEFVDQMLVSKNALAENMVDKPHNQERSSQPKTSVIEVLMANQEEKEPLNNSNSDAGSQQGQGSSKGTEEPNSAGRKKLSKFGGIGNIKAKIAAMQNVDRITEQDEGNGDVESPDKTNALSKLKRRLPPLVNK